MVSIETQTHRYTEALTVSARNNKLLWMFHFSKSLSDCNRDSMAVFYRILNIFHVWILYMLCVLSYKLSLVICFWKSQRTVIVSDLHPHDGWIHDQAESCSA